MSLRCADLGVPPWVKPESPYPDLAPLSPQAWLRSRLGTYPLGPVLLLFRPVVLGWGWVDSVITGYLIMKLILLRKLKFREGR